MVKGVLVRYGLRQAVVGGGRSSSGRKTSEGSAIQVQMPDMVVLVLLCMCVCLWLRGCCDLFSDHKARKRRGVAWREPASPFAWRAPRVALLGMERKTAGAAAGHAGAALL